MRSTTYDLYVHSGPMRKKTFVHVPALTGCIALGDTADGAIENTPDAIRAFLRFIARSGEPVDPGGTFEVRVAELRTDGGWSAQGSGFLTTDAKPLTPARATR